MGAAERICGFGIVVLMMFGD